MVQPHTASPGQIIPSEGTNDNFTALSDGTGATDDNSLRLYRAEIYPGAFIANSGGGVWSLVSGLNGAMTAATIYITTSGIMRRISLAQITSRAFTASKDTWISVNGDGTINYDEQTNGATPPAAPTGYSMLAKVVTDGSGITTIWSLMGRSAGEIARTTLQTAGDTITLPNLPAYKYMRIIANLKNSGALTVIWRFNNDSGTNYSSRYSSNGAADTTAASATSMFGSTGSFHIRSVMDIQNEATSEKSASFKNLLLNTVGAANIPGRDEGMGKWSNTTNAISRIDCINTNTGDFAVGSEVAVFGWN